MVDATREQGGAVHEKGRLGEFLRKTTMVLHFAGRGWVSEIKEWKGRRASVRGRKLMKLWKNLIQVNAVKNEHYNVAEETRGMRIQMPTSAINRRNFMEQDCSELKSKCPL